MVLTWRRSTGPEALEISESHVSLWGEDRSWDGTVTDTNVSKSPTLLEIFEKGVGFRGRQYKVGSTRLTR